MNIMKTIGYKERAKFYSDEICEDLKESLFLKKIIKEFNIKTVAEIPCGSGINMEILSQSCERVIMIDKEKSMVKQIKNRVEEKNFLNCKMIVDNIMTYQLEDKPDLTYIPHEALQLFTKEELKIIVNNVMSNTKKYILFDIYNYYGNGEIGFAPKYLVEKKKEFEYLGRKYMRRRMIIKNKRYLKLIFYYSTTENMFTTSIKLYQHSVEDIVFLFSKYDFSSINIFCDYDFNVWKGEKRAFFLICK